MNMALKPNNLGEIIAIEDNEDEEDTEIIDNKDYDLEMDITAKEGQEIDESDNQMVYDTPDKENDTEVRLKTHQKRMSQGIKHL